jgi:ferredoxin-NADP reductase
MSIEAREADTRWQQARVTRIEERTRGVKSFWFELPRPFAFRPGQHVDVRLTAEDGYQARRSYSIASHPGAAGGLELAVELLQDGEVSPFFHEVVQVGDEVEMRGPLGGHFVWDVEEGGPLLLIGGGSGVVPLMSMLRQRAALGDRAPVLLLFSARTWEDVIFRDELLALHERRDGFELVLTLTREAAGARRGGDYARRVDETMVRELLARLQAASHQPLMRAYLCGPNAFVETASRALVDAGVAPGAVRTERYGG